MPDLGGAERAAVVEVVVQFTVYLVAGSSSNVKERCVFERIEDDCIQSLDVWRTLDFPTLYHLAVS